MRHQFSVTPFLLAFLMGILSQGLSVYDIHARQVGALDFGHRSTRATASLAESERPAASGLLTRLRSWSSTIAGDEHGQIAAELLVPVSGIKALKQRAADLVGSMKAIQTKLGDASLTADARTEAKADFERLKGMTDANASDLKDAEWLAEQERNLSPVPAPDSDATRRAAAASHIQVTDRAEQDPKRGFKDHKELLADVMDAGRTGRISVKLRPLQATQGSDEQGVYSDPAGGFLVPHGVAPGLLQTDAEKDFIAPLVTNISPMTAPTVSFNARVDKDHTTSVSGGFVVTRRPETVDGTASRTAFEQVVLTANEEFGLAFATERILNDSPQSFVAIIAAGFGDEFANNAIKERLRGSGVGERLGILHALNACLVSIPKESGQANDTIIKENIDAMAARCWRYNEAVYLANHDTRPQLRSLVQVVGIGGAPVSYFETSNGQEKLDGRPIFFTEHASKLGDVGDLILCNWSQYLEGEYQQLQTAESIHVRFVSAERAFRFYKRNDGRPWWRSPLTPAQSTKTLSPFVAIAAR